MTHPAAPWCVKCWSRARRWSGRTAPAACYHGWFACRSGSRSRCRSCCAPRSSAGKHTSHLRRRHCVVRFQEWLSLSVCLHTYCCRLRAKEKFWLSDARSRHWNYRSNRWLVYQVFDFIREQGTALWSRSPLSPVSRFNENKKSEKVQTVASEIAPIMS